LDEIRGEFLIDDAHHVLYMFRESFQIEKIESVEGVLIRFLDKDRGDR